MLQAWKKQICKGQLVSNDQDVTQFESRFYFCGLEVWTWSQNGVIRINGTFLSSKEPLISQRIRRGDYWAIIRQAPKKEALLEKAEKKEKAKKENGDK